MFVVCGATVCLFVGLLFVCCCGAAVFKGNSIPLVCVWIAASYRKGRAKEGRMGEGGRGEGGKDGGGREGEREGGRERGREGGREGGRKKGREGGRKEEREKRRREKQGKRKTESLVFTSQVTKLLETNCFSVASCYQQLLKDSSVEVHFNFSIKLDK